jgi:hypothetical protein
MTTKLDELVGFLAGREGKPEFLEELAEPTSEANLFLEATRTRSKALIEEPSTRSRPKPRVSRDRIGPITWAGLCLMLTLLALAFWLVESRLRRIEENGRKAEIEAQASTARLEQILSRMIETRLDPADLEPIAKTLTRLETSLQRLERSPDAPGPDPILAQVRDDLANLRLELSAGEKTKGRKIEELQASIHEVGRVLRLLLTRLEPPQAPTTPEQPPRTFPSTRPSGTPGRN